MVVVVGATVVLVDVDVLVLVVVGADVVDVDVLVVVGANVVEVDVVEVEVEVDVVEVDVEEVVVASGWKLMWCAALRVSPAEVTVAKITHGVVTQLTIVPLVATNVDRTTNGTGMVCGSLGVLGALIGLNSALLPVVNEPRGLSHRVRSAVHCCKVPPVALAPKRRPVTWTVWPDTRLSLGVTSNCGSTKRGSGKGGRTGS